MPAELFLVAARTLADELAQSSLDEGGLYPQLNTIRDVSLKIAVAVARRAFALGIAQRDEPEDLEQEIAVSMYDPHY